MNIPGLPLLPIALAFAGALASATPWTARVDTAVPDVTGSAHHPTGGFSLEFEGPPGGYPVEFSTHLTPASWAAAGTATIPADATSALFQDATAAGKPRGFYRIDGAFEAEAWHLMIPSWTLEWGFDANPAQRRGELTRGITSFDATLETRATAAGASLRLTGGGTTLHALRPRADAIEAFADRFSERTRLPLTPVSGGGFDLALPEEPMSTLSGEGVEQARVISLRPLENDGSSLIALSPRRYTATSRGPEAAPFEGLSMEMPVLVRKSTDADASAMAGPWGIVLFGGVAYDESFGPPVLSKIHECRINVMTAQISADGPRGGTILVSREHRFLVTQPFDPALPVSWDRGESTEGFGVPFALATDGAVRLGDPADENPITGHVSPSAALMVFFEADPPTATDLPTEVSNVSSSLVFAVKRETHPQLAGHSFEATWLSLVMNQGRWRLASVKDGGTLTFNATADTARIDVGFVYEFVDFAGGHILNDDFPEQIDLDVVVDPDGRVSIGLLDDGFFFDATGFVQSGGGMMVLGISYADPEDREAGLLILRKRP